MVSRPQALQSIILLAAKMCSIKIKWTCPGLRLSHALILPFQTPCPHSHPQLTAMQSLGQTPGLCYSVQAGEAERGRGLDPFSGSVCFTRQGQLRGCSTCTGLSLPPSLSHTHCSERLQAWLNALPPGASTLHWFLNKDSTFPHLRLAW